VREIIRGASVTGAARAGVLLIQIGGDIVLAWLLDPADFGKFLKLYVITGFVMQFKDFGLSAATIQSQTITKQEASNLHWINVAVGFVLTLVFLLMSPFIARFYAEDQYTYLGLALAPVFFISSLAIQRQAQFIKNQNFSTVAIASLASTLSSYVITAIFAIYEFGVWALVLGLIARHAIYSIIIIQVSSWKPVRFRKDSDTMRHVRFGTDVFKFDVINYIARNIDNVVLGKIHGDQILGIYARAYQVMLLPIVQLRGPIVSVGMPVLSKASGDTEEHWKGFMWIVNTVASLSIPAAACVFHFRHQIVVQILGPKWSDSSSLIGYLAPASVLQATCGLLGLYLLSQGRSQKYFRWGVGYSIVTSLTILLGSFFGVKELAIAYSISQCLLYLPSAWYCFNKDPKKVWEFTRASVLPLCCGAIAMLMVTSSQEVFQIFQNQRIQLAANVLLYLLFHAGIYFATKGLFASKAKHPVGSDS
jgi:O-antigen/teichoic acid export membrane protein